MCRLSPQKLAAIATRRTSSQSSCLTWPVRGVDLQRIESTVAAVALAKFGNPALLAADWRN